MGVERSLSPAIKPDRRPQSLFHVPKPSFPSTWINELFAPAAISGPAAPSSTAYLEGDGIHKGSAALISSRALCMDDDLFLMRSPPLKSGSLGGGGEALRTTCE